MSVWIKLYSSTHSLTPESKLGNGSCLFYSCQDQHEAHWVKTSMNFPRPNNMPDSPAGLVTDLASRKRERSIMTASQVLCFSCSSIAVNFRRMIDTIRSISLGAIGRVRLCSRSRFTTWLVNSLHACKQTPRVSQYIRLSLHKVSQYRHSITASQPHNKKSGCGWGSRALRSHSHESAALTAISWPRRSFCTINRSQTLIHTTLPATWLHCLLFQTQVVSVVNTVVSYNSDRNSRLLTNHLTTFNVNKWMTLQFQQADQT